MYIDDKSLEAILLKENYLSEEEIKKAKSAIAGTEEPLAKYLLEQEFLTKNLIGQAIADSFGISYSDLSSNQPAKEQVQQIPEQVAKKWRCILYSQNADKKTVTIATDSPKKELTSEIKKIFPATKVIVTYSFPEDIDEAFASYRKPLETRFSEILKTKRSVAPEVLEQIFEDAYTFHASDIHFEPNKKNVVIRFRIDGMLHEAGVIPKELYENILNRIKVESRLRIDEHLAAQDGSMHFEKEEQAFDLRTSIVPTVEGEKIVLRVLAAYVQGLGLSSLGLSPSHQKILEQVIKKPFGMILIVGPTGSGKTTTLYAVLKRLHRPEVNITTIEDPVEYKITGINQIQVNPQTNLTFAKGLRSIVRQDPDIVLVGEIRDEETSEIAINAALTGHLLLSTFHANDAATAIPRLLDMKAEPFLLASTLEVVIAQRLVRKICAACRHSVPLDLKGIDQLFPDVKKSFAKKNTTLYAGKGCGVCAQTGYHGRTAVYEFIRMTPELQELILRNPSAAEIRQLARSQGSRSLFEDGIEKVKSGVTTLEELLRVAAPIVEKRRS